MEAKDKKGIENAGMATGWHAPVPCQQNFCDCGVFLLHFAETFFSDAKKYTNVILGKSPTGAERSELWRQAELHNDQGRAKLKEAITDLSKEWKLQRATTSEQMSSELDSKEQVKVEESDDDIEVIDVQGVKKGKPKAAVGNTAKRKMGVAARVRG
ncbi:hypothetical protein CPB83DRAFT_337487 [Crepidotus variabilis]|uniref:Ubiquitin-like protease family profile domain-containing protein n=1 Tax=Crepidotus variabilis TaxID=179855 RepID=A0A9P6JUM7_9AGAR|nr:hypothetical protein CPB83DRAFT_337487 [Crepidotus variabilis]